MAKVRLEVHDDEREVLVGELDGFLGMTAALYRQIGRDWDPGDGAALTPDVALVVRARDQLRGEAPWCLEGTAQELELLLGRLRAGAELALQRGAQPSPGRQSVAMRVADPEGTDTHLDILGVSDALIQRMTRSEGE